LHRRQDFPRHLPNYEQLTQLKQDYGYGTRLAHGVPCASLFESYKRAYPEISALVQYEGKCLDYYAWKAAREGARDRSASDISDESGQPIIRKINLHEMKYSRVRACNDDHVIPRQWDRRRGDYAKLKLDDPVQAYYFPAISMELERFAVNYETFFHQRDFSMSAKMLKCTALASVPDVQGLQKN